MQSCYKSVGRSSSKHNQSTLTSIPRPNRSIPNLFGSPISTLKSPPLLPPNPPIRTESNLVFLDSSSTTIRRCWSEGKNRRADLTASVPGLEFFSLGSQDHGATKESTIVTERTCEYAEFREDLSLLGWDPEKILIPNVTSSNLVHDCSRWSKSERPPSAPL